jgi:hypothetical protein
MVDKKLVIGILILAILIAGCVNKVTSKESSSKRLEIVDVVYPNTDNNDKITIYHDTEYVYIYCYKYEYEYNPYIGWSCLLRDV